ncbi:transglutaminase domain-containing protein [Lysinibacillus sp. CNPSo 3705]|uniref:transglutaminase domain-containing protein n=1 Tax=Lysinibacillus sp. CNPSo 3705 TaxID=3028148 RepID=UPI0030825FC5
MGFVFESENSGDYLLELDVVDYSNSIIKEKIEGFFNLTKTETAFEFVRDEISHSWDIQGEKVTCHALDVLKYKQRYLYEKSNLLAALLRSQGIQTNFCYQHLMLFDTPEKGYSIHALNTVYLKSNKSNYD